MQQFLAAVLQRACAHPARGPGAAAEAQTLAMAMGLVAAVLGGAVQVRGEAGWVWGGGLALPHPAEGALAQGPCSVAACK